MVVVGTERNKSRSDEVISSLSLHKLTLLMESNNSLGNRLADSVNLRHVATTLDAHANIKRSKSFLSHEQNWLVDFSAKNFGLEQINRGAIDLQKTFTALADGNSGSSSLK